MKTLIYALIFFGTASLVASSHPSIDVVASDWKFTPGTVIVHLNEQATLRMTSSEGVHGLASPELGIPSTVIPPATFVTVNFTPKKVGTYDLHCSIICGAGHPNMKLVVKVLP